MTMSAEQLAVEVTRLGIDILYAGEGFNVLLPPSVHLTQELSDAFRRHHALVMAARDLPEPTNYGRWDVPEHLMGEPRAAQVYDDDQVGPRKAFAEALAALPSPDPPPYRPSTEHWTAEEVASEAKDVFVEEWAAEP